MIFLSHKLHDAGMRAKRCFLTVGNLGFGTVTEEIILNILCIFNLFRESNGYNFGLCVFLSAFCRLSVLLVFL